MANPVRNFIINHTKIKNSNYDYFYNYKRINGINIISLPQLYADLKSYRGRGEEAAKMLGDLNV